MRGFIYNDKQQGNKTFTMTCNRIDLCPTPKRLLCEINLYEL